MGKPASIGAVIMFGGGLLIYWALSQWGLFVPKSESSIAGRGRKPTPLIDTSVPLIETGGGGSTRF